MYRRKRRNRGTWLQTLPFPLGEGSVSALNGFSFALPLDPTQIITHVQPVTTDAPSFQGDAVSSQSIMGDVIGNEYFLDRIVGKIFLTTGTGAYQDASKFLFTILVGCGFFVARADDLDSDLPIGGQAGAEVERHYCPLEADTVREPWIWRRTWMLGDQYNVTNAGLDVIADSFPTSNCDYGSVLDGPHIDAKTKRRVGQEDRLWFAAAASYVPGFGQPIVGLIEENQPLRGYVDLRLHGALRKARQTGRF